MTAQSVSARAPETLGQFVVLLIRNMIRRWPIKLLLAGGVALVTWVLHTYLLVVANEGFAAGTNATLDLILALSDRVFSGTIFWTLLAALVVTAFFRVVSYGLGNTVRSVIETPGWLWAALTQLTVWAAPLFFAGYLAGLIAGAIINNRLISLQFALLGVGILIARQTSVLFNILRLGWSDAQRLMKLEKSREFNYYWAGLVVLGALWGLIGAAVQEWVEARLAFTIISSFSWVVYPLVCGCTSVFFLGFLALALTRRPKGGGDKATLALAVLIPLALALLVAPVYADDGGWAESGSTLGGWIRSEGAGTAVAMGFLPAMGAGLGVLAGSLLGGAAGVMAGAGVSAAGAGLPGGAGIPAGSPPPHPHAPAAKAPIGRQPAEAGQAEYDMARAGPGHGLEEPPVHDVEAPPPRGVEATPPRAAETAPLRGAEATPSRGVEATPSPRGAEAAPPAEPRPGPAARPAVTAQEGPQAVRAEAPQTDFEAGPTARRTEVEEALEAYREGAPATDRAETAPLTGRAPEAAGQPPTGMKDIRGYEPGAGAEPGAPAGAEPGAADVAGRLTDMPEPEPGGPQATRASGATTAAEPEVGGEGVAGAESDRVAGLQAKPEARPGPQATRAAEATTPAEPGVAGEGVSGAEGEAAAGMRSSRAEMGDPKAAARFERLEAGGGPEATRAHPAETILEPGSGPRHGRSAPAEPVSVPLPPIPVPPLDAGQEEALATQVGAGLWWLVMVRGPETGRRYQAQAEMRLGRDRQQADIWLDDPKVSRRHALLERLGAALQITDLNSSNGTFVNEHRISGPTLLRPGDKVRIGDTELVVTDQAE